MGPCRLLKTIFAQFLGKYRVVSALFGKIERLTFTGTFDAFQHLVKSHSFKQICFPHRSEMGVLKSFPGLRIKRSFFLRYAPGAIRRAFIALPQALPRRFAHRPSRVTSLAKSSFACRNGQSTSRRPRCGMTTPFSSGSGRIFRTQTSRWKSRR